MQPSARDNATSLERQDLETLELLAALSNPLTRSALLEWLQRTGHRLTATRAYSSQDVRSIVGRLVQRQVVLRSEDERTIVIRETARHTILERAHREGRLRVLVDAIRRVEPLAGKYGWNLNQHAFVREFAWALHLGASEELRAASAGWLTTRGAPREALLVAAFGVEPPTAGLEKLPSELADEYLGCLFAHAPLQLTPLPENLLVWVEGCPTRFDPEVRRSLAFLHALRGDAGRGEALLTGIDDAAASCMRAMFALTVGRVADARRFARDSIERTRTKSSKRLRGLESPAAAWVALLLLTDPDLASQPYAAAQLDHYKSTRLTLATHSLELLRRLINGDSVNRAFLEPSLVSTGEGWESLLFFALVTRYRGVTLPRALSNRVLECARQAKSAGYGWVQQALEASASTGTTHTLLDLYEVHEPWRRTLHALEVAMASGASAERGAAADERLIWNFALASSGDFDLTARLQSRTQTIWSSGRQIAWKRLVEVAAHARYITDHDRRVIQHISLDREHHRYGGVTTPLDPAAASALVGHPLVFVDGNFRSPVEVVAGVGRLEVRQEAGNLVLTLAPEGLLTGSIVCEREGPARLVVYALDDAQQRVARVFQGRSIQLPSQAREAAHATLAKLAARFALSADHEIAAQQVEEIAADAQIRVRLRRRGTGIAVRLCVLPVDGSQVQVPGAGNPRLIVHVPQDGGAKPVCVVRNLAAEQSALHALYVACPTLADVMGGEHEAAIDDVEGCLELLLELRASAAQVEWPEGEPLRLTAERDVRNMRLRLSTAADWLAADGELEIDEDTRLALHELLARAAASRGRFIALDDGRYVALTDTLKKRLDSMSALASVKNTAVTVHPLWLGIAGLSDDYAELASDARATKLLARAREARQLEPVLPSGFEAELRPYQREGFEWLCRLAHVRAGACLADDMGLGKTLQTLALLLKEAAHGPSLVVAPTSVCSNWFDEARRFAPALRLHDFATADRATTVPQLEAYDVLIASYGIVQQEIEHLAAKHFRVVVVDEAQAIKNASTQRARAIRQLSAEIRIALTGTPLENHIGELWSIMQFLNPGLLGSSKAFEERFGKPIARDSDLRAADILKRLIRPFVLRRLKSAVLDDLPSKTVITMRVEPSDAERALFGTLRERALARLSDASRAPAAEARIQLLAELTRLRRAACHPRLVAPEAEIASSKLYAFEELLGELREGGHRVLVFSQFIDYLAIVRSRLEELGVSYQYLDGSSSPVARKRAVTAFQAGEGDVFLISLKAGGFGLNLTAADYVVHLDPWWNPAVEEQASDRAHRIGQTRPVTIYRLVMRDSIEEKILDLHAHKRDLADRLLEGTGNAAVSVDELLALIRPEVEADEAGPSRRARKVQS